MKVKREIEIKHRWEDELIRNLKYFFKISVDQSLFRPINKIVRVGKKFNANVHRQNERKTRYSRWIKQATKWKLRVFEIRKQRVQEKTELHT